MPCMIVTHAMMIETQISHTSMYIAIVGGLVVIINLHDKLEEFMKPY